MANHDLSYIPDPDADSISSDVVGFNGILVSTQIPTRADGSLELGDITVQSECTLQALKVALEKAGSSMDRVMAKPASPPAPTVTTDATFTPIACVTALPR